MQEYQFRNPPVEEPRLLPMSILRCSVKVEGEILFIVRSSNWLPWSSLYYYYYYHYHYHYYHHHFKTITIISWLYNQSSKSRKCHNLSCIPLNFWKGHDIQCSMSLDMWRVIFFPNQRRRISPAHDRNSNVSESSNPETLLLEGWEAPKV